MVSTNAEGFSSRVKSNVNSKCLCISQKNSAYWSGGWAVVLYPNNARKVHTSRHTSAIKLCCPAWPGDGGLPWNNWGYGKVNSKYVTTVIEGWLSEVGETQDISKCSVQNNVPHLWWEGQIPRRRHLSECWFQLHATRAQQPGNSPSSKLWLLSKSGFCMCW